MRSRTKLATGLATAAASLGLGLIPATAETAHAAPKPSAVTARCHYTIAGSNVNIRSYAGTQHRVVRVKQNGEPVTGPAPCTATSWSGDYWWVKLYLGSGGYGWVAEPYVHLVDYS